MSEMETGIGSSEFEDKQDYGDDEDVFDSNESDDTEVEDVLDSNESDDTEAEDAFDSNESDDAEVDESPAPVVAEDGSETGVVKWFSNTKGYGFIARDQGGDDVFVHFSAVQMEGYRTLEEGVKVQFKLEQGEKGPAASDVKLI